MTILEANNIKKSYGDLQVLKGVNLQVQKGEVVSIVGASGAGKSTLLHILGTLDVPDSGSVMLNGNDITSLGDQHLARIRNQQLGFIFQFHNLLPEFTALENACMPGFLGGKNEATVRARGTELLEYLGVAHRIGHKPSEMSGGEQQRVAVARALLNEPAIIFADEPSGNLDSKNAEELHKLFFKLRDEFKQTFVIVTHNEQLARNADRMIEMRDGIIV